MIRTKVKFYNSEFKSDDKLIYSVIVAKYHDKWVFVRHHQRATFEIPGGHIEKNETPEEAAGRELMEETGAIEFSIKCVSTYSVTQEGETRFGKLYFAEIIEIGPIPDISEIEEIAFLDDLPDPVTYPEIQPSLFNKVIAFLKPNL
jgi:8-oxo-dGTP diphosphatase